MKNILCILFLAFFIQSNIFGQFNNVGIGTTNPDSTAVLEINSSDKGVLIPRLNLAQRSAITIPATSLLIYQTDNIPGYYYYSGSSWQKIGDDLGSHIATQALDMDTNKIVNVLAPINGMDAANKDYVDAAVVAAGDGGCCSSASQMSAEYGPFNSAAIAFNACDTLTEDGFTDWRPPTIDEMIDGLAGITTIPLPITENLLWTRSANTSNGYYRYYAIRMSDGVLSNGNQFSDYPIRCVRGD